MWQNVQLILTQKALKKLAPISPRGTIIVLT